MIATAHTVEQLSDQLRVGFVSLILIVTFGTVSILLMLMRRDR